MFNARRLLRLASLAAVLAITTLVSACSSDLTGPSAKRRSGYITTSGSMQSLTVGTSTGTTTTTTGTTTSGGTLIKKAPADSSNSTSGYNVPAF